jgi:hypothetical protein
MRNGGDNNGNNNNNNIKSTEYFIFPFPIGYKNVKITKYKTIVAYCLWFCVRNAYIQEA